ncbi:unnamed protein product [Timema podura]|uniref:Uncharacterized protein n=1 Tax=Timema podura TaxID=61482 RepID=A0ABN7PG45_TIMPD|nr:unnamed protein product [Timema podura]
MKQTGTSRLVARNTNNYIKRPVNEILVTFKGRVRVIGLKNETGIPEVIPHEPTESIFTKLKSQAFHQPRYVISRASFQREMSWFLWLMRFMGNKKPEQVVHSTKQDVDCRRGEQGFTPDISNQSGSWFSTNEF